MVKNVGCDCAHAKDSASAERTSESLVHVLSFWLRGHLGVVGIQGAKHRRAMKEYTKMSRMRMVYCTTRMLASVAVMMSLTAYSERNTRNTTTMKAPMAYTRSVVVYSYDTPLKRSSLPIPASA